MPGNLLIVAAVGDPTRRREGYESVLEISERDIFGSKATDIVRTMLADRTLAGTAHGHGNHGKIRTAMQCYDVPGKLLRWPKLCAKRFC